MNSVSSPQPLKLQLSLTEINGKSIFVDFEGVQISSNGGLLLLHEYEQQSGIFTSLTYVIHDPRYVCFAKHTIMDAMMQHISHIAADCEDADDCDELRCKPIIKMWAVRLPETDDDLAS